MTKKFFKKISPFLLIVSLILILISGLFSFMGFLEYYNVGILQKTKDYPFGKEGSVAGLWQYENANNYTKFNLISVIL